MVRVRTVAWVFFGCVLSALCPRAHADEVLKATARVARPMAALNEEDPTAAGTKISLENRPIALETTSEVVRQVPGAQVSEVGAYGTFSGVSLRGSEPAHTTWLLGDIPLSGNDSGALDVSTLPLPLFASLEVYRGGAPLWFSQGSIGGVMRLVPREADAREVRATLGAGSFGRLELRLSSELRGRARRAYSLFTGVNVLHSTGNFLYRDDNGTPRTSDDESRRIRNAEVDDASGLMHARVSVLGGDLDVLALGFERTGGVPGPAGGSINARDTRRHFSRGLLALAYTHEKKTLRGRRRYRAQLLGSVRAELNRVSDPLAELGLGGSSWSNDVWVRGFARVAGSVSPVRWLELSTVATYARDTFDSADLAIDDIDTSERDTLSAGAEVAFRHKHRHFAFELRPSVLGIYTAARLPDVDVSRPIERNTNHTLPVLRVGVAISPYEGITLRGSAASGARLPSVLELFGDRAYVRGNRALSPERSRSVDAGIVVTDAFSIVCLSLEFAAFYQRVEDLIRFTRTSQLEVTAFNLEETTIRGLELSLDAGVSSYAALKGQIRLLDTEDVYGNTSPFQPHLLTYVRPEVYAPTGLTRAPRLTLFATVDHQGARFQDSANLRVLPAQTRVGAGFSLPMFEQRLDLSGRMTDVFDVRGQDILGFPLPGRSVFVSLTLKEDLT